MSADNVTIIGAGPAGLMAALQLIRFGIRPRVFEAHRTGGLLWNANRVENYLGFPGGISGPDLIARFETQALQAGVVVAYEQVLKLDHDGEIFHLATTKAAYRSKIVVIASGTQPVVFPPDLLPPEVQDRVAYEVAPLRGVVDCDIAIVGAGDAAFDYAYTLEKANRVWILNRSRTVKCLPVLWQRLPQAAGVTYWQETGVVSISLDPAGGLALECNKQEEIIILQVDYLIGALGRTPRVDFIAPALLGKIDALEQQGLLYRIGDVIHGRYRQTAIAAGDGLLAAMKIAHGLEAL